MAANNHGFLMIIIAVVGMVGTLVILESEKDQAETNKENLLEYGLEADDGEVACFRSCGSIENNYYYEPSYQGLFTERQRVCDCIIPLGE